MIIPAFNLQCHSVGKEALKATALISLVFSALIAYDCAKVRFATSEPVAHLLSFLTSIEPLGSHAFLYQAFSW